MTITAFAEDSETEEGLLAVAHAVETGLPGDKDSGLPLLIRCLPAEGLIPGSIEYFLGYLGLVHAYPFSTSDVFRFKKGVRGSYEGGHDLYLLEYVSSRECQINFDQVRTGLKANPRYIHFSDVAVALELRDEHGTLIYTTCRENLIVIVLGALDQGQAKKIADVVSGRR